MQNAKKSFWEMTAVLGILAPSTNCIRVVSFMPLSHFAIGRMHGEPYRGEKSLFFLEE
jgi:hypothetical protein